MDKNIVLISVACIFKEYRGRRWWLLTKAKKEDDWELPRITARKAESSARASIRMAAEQLAITGRVLEEAGRAGGATTVGGKIVPQRHLYYLMIMEAEGGEPLVFYKASWFEYGKAVRKLKQKRDSQMLKNANVELKAWEKREKEALQEK